MPEDIGYITAGIDTQTDRVEIYVYGWREGEKPFALDKLVISRRPVQCRLLGQGAFGFEQFGVSDASPAGRCILTSRRLTPAATTPPQVYWFVKYVRGRRGADSRRYEIIAIKGVPGFNKPVISIGGFNSRAIGAWRPPQR